MASPVSCLVSRLRVDLLVRDVAHYPQLCSASIPTESRHLPHLPPQCAWTSVDDLRFRWILGPIPSRDADKGPNDVKMEDATETNGHVDPGVSIRFGPVKSEDSEMKDAESEAQAGKRKTRTSVDQKKSYAEPESSEEEDQPLVRRALPLADAFPSFPHIMRHSCCRCWLQRLTVR